MSEQSIGAGEWAQGKKEERREDLTVFLGNVIEMIEAKYPELAGTYYATDLELHDSLAVASFGGKSQEKVSAGRVDFNQLFFELDRIKDTNSSLLDDNISHVSEMLSENISLRADMIMIFRTYLILHELGHIKDFLDKESSLGGTQKAYEFFKEEQRVASKTALVLGLSFDQMLGISEGKYNDLRQQNPDFFVSNNIFNLHDLLLLAAKVQRDTPQERRADNFAKENMKVFYPEFGGQTE